MLGKKHVLVTGGAGFIGSSLCAQLCRLGARVTVLDNLANGREENLAGLSDHGLHLVLGDVRDEGAVRDVMAGVDVVFHLACLGVRHSIHSPLENHEANATGTLRLLAAAQGAGVDRFVHVSSSEVYGTAQWAPMGEEHPTFPRTVYGASKLAAEGYARAYHDTYGLPTVVIRPFNAFGPRCHHEGDSGEVIPKFMLRCMAGAPLIIFGTGEQTRDFTYVDDTAAGIMAAATADAAIGETINLGSGREVTINNLAAAVASAVGRNQADVERRTDRPGDVGRLCAGVTKSADLLNFQPHVSLQDGLKRLHAWYQAQPHTAAELLADEVVENWQASK
jgi:UDP-glucose 4-epimerase